MYVSKRLIIVIFFESGKINDQFLTTHSFFYYLEESVLILEYTYISNKIAYKIIWKFLFCI